MTAYYWFALAAAPLIIASLFAARRAYGWLRLTQESRAALEAQKHMLRFCKNPTRRNWDAAWSFLSHHDVKLINLDWPLVERFAKTASHINFPPDAQPS